MVKKNQDFRFNRKRKSGKTEFFEVHIERALITHLISVVRHIRCLPLYLNGIYSSQMVKRSLGETFWKGRLNGLIRLASHYKPQFKEQCPLRRTLRANYMDGPLWHARIHFGILCCILQWCRMWVYIKTTSDLWKMKYTNVKWMQ